MRIVCNFANRRNERVPIDPGLSRAEILRLSLEDTYENRALRMRRGETPHSLAHQMVIRPFRKSIQISLQIVDAVELRKVASIQGAEADASRFPQALELCRVLGLALLDQSQALPKNLTRIMALAGADQSSMIPS
jgi:hypothetical protein